MITLRPIAPDDSPAIAKLVDALGYAAAEAQVRERIVRLARTPDQLLLAACSGDQIVGWLQAQEHETIEAGRRVEILGMVVDSEHRRAGAGRSLIAAATDWAQQRQVGKLVVRSNVARTESHRFYRALGFQLDKTQAVYALALT